MGGGVCTGRTVLKGYGERGGIFLRTKKFKVVLQILPLNLLRCANESIFTLKLINVKSEIILTLKI